MTPTEIHPYRAQSFRACLMLLALMSLPGAVRAESPGGETPLAVTVAGHPATSRRVTGTVQDPVGGVVRGAEVIAACGPVRRQTITGQDGTFTMADLPDTTCSLRVEATDFSPKRLSLDLTRGDEHVTVVLDLRGLTAEVAVIASRSNEELASRVPAYTTVTHADEILARVQQVLSQALAEEPGIVVQQTTSSQGAPVIRGLTGYQNVALVDGVRLNTSAWRSGPVQYLAWYDASVVDRIEVMRGPASALYGSDALGGSVQVHSIQPSFSAGTVTARGTANLAFSSADAGRGANARVDVSGRRAGLVAAGGYHKFDDIRPGKGIDSRAAVTRFLGLPSDVLGSTRLQNTGYEQKYGHLAAAFGLGGSTRIDASYHYDEQTGASRYDRIGGGDGLFRSEFGPERLDLAHVRLEHGRTGFLDGVTATFSVNRQSDGRLEQARPSAQVDRQQNTTTSFGYQLQGVRRIGPQQITAGAELYDEYIGGDRTISPIGAPSRAARPDVPDGTRYTSLGVFGQDVVDVIPQRLSVRGGVRYGRFNFGTKADSALGVANESVSADAVTFQGGAVIDVTDRLSLTASVGKGFRAPNATDLGMIGVTSVLEVAPSRVIALGGLMGTSDGSTATSTGRAIEPLGPESLYSFEAGLRVHGQRVTASVAVYSNEMRNAILRRTVLFPTDITGTNIGGFEIARVDAEGRAFIATQAAPLVTRVNVAKARIRGIEGEARWHVSADWLASTFLSYSEGTDLDANLPLRRVPPGVGGVRLRWQPALRSFWTEGVATFTTRYSRMAAGDLTDARMGARRTTASIASYFNGTATDLGLVRNGVLVATGETLAQVQQRVLNGAASADLFPEIPGHVVTTLRAGFRISQQLELLVVADNIGDVNYRNLGSGVDAPGRNVRVHTRITF